MTAFPIIVYLALVPMKALDKEPPVPVGVYSSLEACVLYADKLNRVTEKLKEPAAVALGLEFVCMPVVRTGV